MGYFFGYFCEVFMCCGAGGCSVFSATAPLFRHRPSDSSRRYPRTALRCSRAPRCARERALVHAGTLAVSGAAAPGRCYVARVFCAARMNVFSYMCFISQAVYLAHVLMLLR